MCDPYLILMPCIEQRIAVLEREVPEYAELGNKTHF